jgi:hypothetical protein
MRRFKINKNKTKDLPTFPVGYGKDSIMVHLPENPREGVCDACGRSIEKREITITQLHHWIYAWKMATVRKDPYKVLENLSELCYSDHKIGDSLREILSVKKERLISVIQVALLMPEEMKDKLDWIARAWLNARKTDKKKVKLEEFDQDE